MKFPEHTSNTYDAQLEIACEKVMRMGELVQNQFAIAVGTLSSCDLIEIDNVLDMGHVVNAMEVEIDDLCTNILVRRQPTANDLRLVTTIIKTINDLERIGDEAESIARLSRQIALKAPMHLPSYSHINFIAEIAAEMVDSALTAFDSLDDEAAQKMGYKDSLIDQEGGATLRGLIGYMMEDTSELSIALHVALIARSIERVGNHAKHIAEYVVYLIQGREARNFCTI